MRIDLCYQIKGLGTDIIIYPLYSYRKFMVMYLFFEPYIVMYYLYNSHVLSL